MDVMNEVDVISRKCGDGYGSFHGPALTDTWCRGEISTQNGCPAMLIGSATGDPLTVGTVGLGNTSSDQVCPVVPEIHDWKRREALGSDGYDYYEDFGHPIMMTPGITESGMIGAILRIPKDIMTLSRAKWRTILALLVVRQCWPLMRW